jgi:acyl-CoA thioesterase FadM
MPHPTTPSRFYQTRHGSVLFGNCWRVASSLDRFRVGCYPRIVNLWLRLLLLLCLSRFRRRCDILGPCLTPFRVLPSDLDLLGHMNNGKYLSLLDLARTDLIIRSRILPQLIRRHWYPVVAAETIAFKNSLKLGERFHVSTAIIGWNAEQLVVRQDFLRDSKLIAQAFILAVFLRRAGGKVSTEEILALAGKSAPSPALPAWVAEWAIQVRESVKSA